MLALEHNGITNIGNYWRFHDLFEEQMDRDTPISQPLVNNLKGLVPSCQRLSKWIPVAAFTSMV